jgi:predicted AlkP superfamily phosphohydrolase/phosphomutase
MLAMACAGCVEDRPLSLVLGPQVRLPERSVVVFLADGLDRGTLRTLLAEGRLPNIRKHFVEGGVGVENAVASMPAVTYPNCSSLITGRFPGHHGILGNFWFDRRKLEARHYMSISTYLSVNEHLSVPTIYDLLHDRFTVSIASHTRRGVAYPIDNGNMFFWSWVFGRYLDADRYVGQTL